MLCVGEFLSERMSGLLHELCTLYPCHPRVAKLGVFLIEKQIREQHPALLNIFGLYTKRKLDEVLQLSLQQFKKQQSHAISNARTLDKSSLLPIPVDLYCNPRLKSVLERICKLMCIVNTSGGELNLSHEKEWPSIFRCDPCSFTMKTSAWATGDITLINELSSLAEDMTELVITLASFCSRFIGGTTSVCHAATNVHNMILSFLDWAETSLSIPSVSEIPDARGKMAIELAKFFSVLLSVLINIDVNSRRFTDCESTKDLFMSCSSTLILAEERGLVFCSSVGRAISTAIRKNVLLYYESTRYIHNISVDYVDGTIEFIRDLVYRKLVMNRHDFNEGIFFDVLINGSESEGCSDIEEDWIRDPSVRREVKKILGPEVAEAIGVLANLKAKANELESGIHQRKGECV